MDLNIPDDDGLTWKVRAITFTDDSQPDLFRRLSEKQFTEETDSESGSSSAYTINENDKQQGKGTRRYSATNDEDEFIEEDVFIIEACNTTPDHNNNAKATDERKRKVSYVTAIGYEGIDEEAGPSSDSCDINNQQHTSQNRRFKIKRQLAFTVYDDDVEIISSSSHTNDSDGKDDESSNNKIDEECETEMKRSSRTKHVSDVKVTCREETGKKPTNDENDKKHSHKKCKLHRYDSEIKVCHLQEEIAKYCLLLPNHQFVGQTTTNNDPDEFDEERIETFHLGALLQHMDSYLRTFQSQNEFKGDKEYYLKLLRYIARKRCMPDETEEECYERLLVDSKRFVDIYQRRGEHSEVLKGHANYWGSRQQLLSAAVIADWVDKENGRLDPIFGVLLQPTTGRTGPGDSCILHHYLFDGHGKYALHSAVHDAFGYLKNKHDVGPGYDYMGHSIFKTSSPLAGQVDGLRFWKKALKQIPFKPTVHDITNRVLSMHIGWHPEKHKLVETGKQEM